MTHLLGLPGSARAGSTNRALLDLFAAARAPGVTMDVYGDMAGHPVFSPDYGTDVPGIIAAFIARVRAADGLVIACPEYAGGIPGGLKNALDWLVSDTDVPNTPVMLIHASKRSHGSRVHLREVLRTMSLQVYAGDEYERHLIGKTPEEVAAQLGSDAERQAMTECLAGFVRFIADSR